MKAIPPVAITTQVLKNMVDPRRPWRRLNWIRIVDFYHAAQYVQQLGEAIFGAGTAASNWAHEMRQTFKAKPDGVSRGLKSASALRRSRGLRGQATLYPIDT